MAERGRDVHHRDPAGGACVRVRTALVHAWPPGRGAEGMTRFDNLSVLVTGGGSGIGRAICRRFASEGASVLVADIVGESAEEVAALIGGAAVQGDVTVAADVARMVAAGNRIDVLVNNAGGGMAGAMLGIAEEASEPEIALHLKSGFPCLKAVFPRL